MLLLTFAHFRSSGCKQIFPEGQSSANIEGIMYTFSFLETSRMSRCSCQTAVFLYWCWASEQTFLVGVALNNFCINFSLPFIVVRSMLYNQILVNCPDLNTPPFSSSPLFLSSHQHHSGLWALVSYFGCVFASSGVRLKLTTCCLGKIKRWKKVSWERGRGRCWLDQLWRNLMEIKDAVTFSSITKKYKFLLLFMQMKNSGIYVIEKIGPLNSCNICCFWQMKMWFSYSAQHAIFKHNLQLLYWRRH